ncbi:AP-1-like transcription factor [Sphaceloma murrayae]|uniref:AP-1-like transcription factor n=1 Tax=Sphaceloma murrayae TaxID=2082308 RepID=A0A2K1QQF0_9PEZI|nr:AP-1-like transcription factor [Sphaceloma murrayae]
MTTMWTGSFFGLHSPTGALSPAFDMTTYDPGMAHQMGQGEYGQYGGQMQSENGSRSPLNVARSFLSNNTTKQTKDGREQKRRGPKPDSKPALTRRQELNRQAQRTHRERKEQYIKALEQEVLKLKELFANTSRERDAVIQDNQKLRDILRAHGIQIEMPTPSASYGTTIPSYNGSTSGSAAGSYSRHDSSATALSPSPVHSRHSPHQMQTGSIPQMPTHPTVELDQLGIDFVLAYDPQGRPAYPSPPPGQ